MLRLFYVKVVSTGLLCLFFALELAADLYQIVVLGTKIEVSQDGVLTGRFLTKNCFGQEKVNRLLEKEPDRNNYFLFAYGDSRGDKEMLAFADKGFLCK